MQINNLLLLISLNCFIISATKYCDRTGFNLTWDTRDSGPNAHYSYIETYPSLAYGVPDGYTVHFRCNFHQRLTGPSSVTCQDGSWSAQPGHCERTGELKYLTLQCSKICMHL